jgi:RNA polymerase sigma-70 factor (ECF subfamily)
MNFEDIKFVAKLRAGDRQALDAVVRAYLGQIFRAAVGAGLNEDRAEDVTQATFATFIEKIGNFDGRSHVRTWLFGILYNKIMESHREEKRDLQKDDIDETVEQRFEKNGGWFYPPVPVEETMHRTEIQARIKECLDVVPTQQRMAFTLREVEGYSTKEICNIMKVTRTNLGALLHRCRNRLRECLEAKGIRGSRDAKL